MALPLPGRQPAWGRGAAWPLLHGNIEIEKGAQSYSQMWMCCLCHLLFSPDMDVVLGQLGRPEGGSCLDSGELLDSYWAFSNSVSNYYR